MAELVTLGECLISLVARDRGPLTESDSFLRTVAGAEANVAVGVSRLGHTVSYLGRVGDDAFGTVIRRKLRGEGVDVRWLASDAGAPTGVMIRELRDLGPMEVIYHRAGSAASRVTADEVRAAGAAGAFEGARWLHLTGITPAISASAAAAVEAAIDEARWHGLTVSLDLNIRRRLWSEEMARRVLAALAERCDVVLGGLDEVAVVTGLAPTLEAGGAVDPVDAADALLALGPSRAVVKLGAAGALERRREDDLLVGSSAPAFTVRVVDPVGAGDAFSAAWIVSVLEGASPVEALRAGNAAGAAVVSTVGDLTGMPTRRELDAILRSGDGGPDTIR